MQFLGTVQNPTLAPFAKMDYIIREIAKSMELDPDNFECEGKDEENGHHKHATFYANVALLLYYLTMFQLENTNEYEYQKPAKELIVTRYVVYVNAQRNLQLPGV